MNPLSIALICNSYPPVIGGSEIEAQRVAAELQKRGHRVEVLCAGGDPMPDVRHWIDPAGVPVRIFGGRLRQPLRGYTYALGVAWELLRKRREYDVIYFLMSGLQIATGLPVARWLRKPILMKFSGSSLIRQMNDSALGRMELEFLRRWADRIMVLNPGMFEEAKEARLEEGKLLWMPNPVDCTEFRPASGSEKTELRRSLGLPGDVPITLYVGRLAPEKELASLLRAFALVAPRRPDALLLLVGDGPSRPELEAEVTRLRLSAQVRFTGMVPVAEVSRWVRASDIFALVSSLEGLPCSLIEAMSAGLAAVCERHSGQSATGRLRNPWPGGSVEERTGHRRPTGAPDRRYHPSRTTGTGRTGRGLSRLIRPSLSPGSTRICLRNSCEGRRGLAYFPLSGSGDGRLL